MDIRTKSLNEPDALVLEVNANCGLSFGKGSSSLGEVRVRGAATIHFLGNNLTLSPLDS